MDHLKNLDNEEALDFSLEAPVLDLSCKKQNSSSCSLSPVSIGGMSSPPSMSSPPNEDNSREDHSEGDSERKSPFEGRNFMVTPPSEIDSPKKLKSYESYYAHMSGVTSITSNEPVSQYSMLPTGQTAAILSSAGALQNGVDTSSNRLQLPVSTTNHVNETHCPVTSQENSKKVPRPFKAYPKDPLTMSVGTAELLFDQTSTEAYSEFRKRMLESVRRTNEGTNVKMRRVTKSPGLPTSTIMDEKDAAYWERRRKNNEAAKRSRDARRAKEDEIAIRAAFLEQENIKLKYELVALRNETAKLRCLIYSN